MPIVAGALTRDLPCAPDEDEGLMRRGPSYRVADKIFWWREARERALGPVSAPAPARAVEARATFRLGRPLQPLCDPQLDQRLPSHTEAPSLPI